MPFELIFSEEAHLQLDELEEDRKLLKRLKAVNKALSYLQANPRHPSLKTHKFESLSRKHNLEVFEAYAENATPQAYRVFWHYGPQKDQITILAITPHP